MKDSQGKPILFYWLGDARIPPLPPDEPFYYVTGPEVERHILLRRAARWQEIIDQLAGGDPARPLAKLRHIRNDLRAEAAKILPSNN